MNGSLDRLNLRPFEKRLVVGVAAMVFVVINVWFVLPHFSDWSRTKLRMAKAQKTLDEFEAEIRQVATYRRKVDELQKENQDVPSEDQAVHFQRAIQNQAAESHVELISQKGSARTNQFFLEQSQIISVTSGEQELVDFLYKLGSGGSLIRVRELSLHTDMARQKLTANIKLVASYQKNPASRSVTPAATTAAVEPPLAQARPLPRPSGAKVARPPAGTGAPAINPGSPAPKPSPQTPRRP
jgi:hypothetical protein